MHVRYGRGFPLAGFDSAHSAVLDFLSRPPLLSCLAPFYVAYAMAHALRHPARRNVLPFLRRSTKGRFSSLPRLSKSFFSSPFIALSVKKRDLVVDACLIKSIDSTGGNYSRLSVRTSNALSWLDVEDSRDG